MSLQILKTFEEKLGILCIIHSFCVFVA